MAFDPEYFKDTEGDVACVDTIRFGDEGAVWLTLEPGTHAKADELVTGLWVAPPEARRLAAALLRAADAAERGSK